MSSTAQKGAGVALPSTKAIGLQIGQLDYAAAAFGLSAASPSYSIRRLPGSRMPMIRSTVSWLH